MKRTKSDTAHERRYSADDLWNLTRVSPSDVKNVLVKSNAFDHFCKRIPRIVPYVSVQRFGRRRVIEAGLSGTF